MRCLVVGAGLIGLTTAWFLRRHGVDVVVCERRSGVGLETSFANGGMLHASQANPWNEPGVLWQALRTLGREDSALLIRPTALLGMLPWAWSFFRNSSRDSYLNALRRNARLAGYSLSVLEQHFAPLALDYAHASLGTLKIYRSEQEFADAQAVAERCCEWGVTYNVLNADSACQLEPALAPLAPQLAGGIHFPGDISGDAHKFCQQLAVRCLEAGVDFEYDASVDRLLSANGQLKSVTINGTEREVDCCVIAAGSFSPGLVDRLGVALPVEPIKGYSITLPLAAWSLAPRVPVIDEHYHAAVCPLGDSLRVAGTAEFAGFDPRLRESRINNLFKLVRNVYPAEVAHIDEDAAERWCGFRPMTPDGVGIMGKTTIDGLYINSGHGHLGWTMAPGAGKFVADIIATGTAEIAENDYALSRFT